MLLFDERSPGEWEIVLDAASPWMPDKRTIAKVARRSGFDGVVYDLDLYLCLPGREKEYRRHPFTARSVDEMITNVKRHLFALAIDGVEDARDLREFLVYQIAVAEQETADGFPDAVRQKELLEAQCDETEETGHVFSMLAKNIVL